MVRSILGFLITLMGALMVVLAAITLLRPVWLQDLYTRANVFSPRPPLPLIADAGLARRAHERVPEPGGRLVSGDSRLGLSSVVIEGDEEAALLLGVGHLSDTPLPWANGNSVFAAHRDTFFRPLEHIRRNDVIRFSTKDAELEYHVRPRRSSRPTTSGAAPTSSSTLTLITCYPFTYVGPAPKRFHRQSRTKVS